MAKTADDEELMREYLLGDLAEGEQAHLEERFLTDDSEYEQLLAIEDELAYDYAEGNLSPRERELFESRLLRSEPDRRKVEFAKVLTQRLAEAEAESGAQSTVAPVVSDSWWRSLWARLSLPAPQLRYALAVAVVVIMIGAAWLVYDNLRLRSRLNQLQEAQTAPARSEQQIAQERKRNDELTAQLERERNERAQLQQQLEKQTEKISGPQPANQPAQPSVIALALAAGLVRGGAEPARIVIPPGTDILSLTFELKETAASKRYRVGVTTAEGRQVLTTTISGPGPGAKAVAIKIPAKLLPPGDYQVTLSGLMPNGALEELADYYFTVLRK